MSLKNVLLATVSLALALPLTATAQTSSTTATSPATASAPAAKNSASDDSRPVTHAEFESLMRATLINDPQMMLDAMKKLHEKQMADASKQVEEAVNKHKDELFNDTQSPSVGDPKTADVTLVEFFDYHCGYCKRFLSVVSKLLDNDKKVRVVFREFPILAEDSALASRAAIAVYKIAPDKYFEFHKAMLESNVKFDDTSIANFAKKVDIDPKKLKKEMANPDITQMLDANRSLAEDLMVRGTPALVIGDTVLPGAVPYEDLVKMIDNVRKGEKVDTSIMRNQQPE